MDRSHWDNIYEMYIRKYNEVVQEIKETKFPIHNTMPLSEQVDILTKREDFITKYLMHETAKYRLNWVMELNKNM